MFSEEATQRVSVLELRAASERFEDVNQIGGGCDRVNSEQMEKGQSGDEPLKMHHCAGKVGWSRGWLQGADFNHGPWHLH